MEWIIIGVVVLVAVFVILLYNGLVQKKLRVGNAWSQIDVQLQRRSDLVPNLVETVKGYAKHEKEVFENVTKARGAMLSASSVKEKGDASNMLSGALKSLFAVAEDYPRLKANENFRLLQEQLDGIESKIAYARQFYNDSVLDYNTAIHTIPSNVIASSFGFKEMDFFETTPEQRKVVNVKF
jgi:LemA protein